MNFGRAIYQSDKTYLITSFSFLVDFFISLHIVHAIYRMTQFNYKKEDYLFIYLFIYLWFI
jgi:hypothetical protein